MSVRDYYYQHFDDLESYDKFHFASRIKNFSKSHDFDDYFKTNILDQDLASIFSNNDYSKINHIEARKPYFEKYQNLFAIEAALFRVKHLLDEWNIDIRKEFLKYEPLEKLYALSDQLMNDNAALAALSTWAVNIICLTEYLFPRGQNVVETLSEKAPSLDFPDPLLAVYYYTHIIICDTNFYTLPISPENQAMFASMLGHVAKIIEQNFDSLILDARIEFLVCANLVGQTFPNLQNRIKTECSGILKNHSFIVDQRRPKFKQTFSGAEHTNVLYIMSGLDAED